jgi:hypothetical protein
MSDIILKIKYGTDHLELDIERDGYLLSAFGDRNGYGVYIGPKLTTPSQCMYLVEYDEYREFIGAFLRGTMFEVVDQLHYIKYHEYVLGPIDPIIRAKTPDADWEWLELINDRGLKALSNLDIYKYFLNKAYCLKSIKHCITYRTVLAMLANLDVYFSDLHTPNKDAQNYIKEIIKKPCDIVVSQG